MTFDDKAIDWLSDLMAQTAKDEIMSRFRRLETGDIRQKTSATDLVTEADVNAERVITKALKQRWPDALVVGEEAHAEDKTILPKLGGADLAFVIDPVDGTINFASGLPLFGVMLAVVVKGETVAGIIHDPVGHDFLIGSKGAGSQMRRADGSFQPCRVADRLPVLEMVGAASTGYMPEPDRARVARNHARFKSSFNYRVAAHEYRLLAQGFAHFLVYTALMPWDHLAGTLIHAEAGGYTARLDGSPYLPSHTGGGILVAPDKESWQDLRQTLWQD